MKKLMFILGAMLASTIGFFSLTTNAAEIFYADVKFPIRIDVNGSYGYVVDIIDQRNSYDFGQDYNKYPIIVTKVIAKRPNGSECPLKIRYSNYFKSDIPPFKLKGNSIDFDSSVSLKDVSEDGCYPNLDTVYVETQDHGNWEYKYGKGLKALTDPYMPAIDRENISVRIDFDAKLVGITSNVEEITISPPQLPYDGVKNAEVIRSLSCQFKIPNSNKHDKVIKEGEEVIYQFDSPACGSFEELWIDTHINGARKRYTFFSENMAFGYRR